MCGRYTLATRAKKLAEEFGFDASSIDLPPNYNLAPTQGIAAVLAEGGEKRLEILRWGLVSPWADDPQIGSRMINVRAETAPRSLRSAGPSASAGA
jgi:putative SOS response-associated peptidase YedK